MKQWKYLGASCACVSQRPERCVTPSSTNPAIHKKYVVERVSTWRNAAAASSASHRLAAVCIKMLFAYSSCVLSAIPVPLTSLIEVNIPHKTSTLIHLSKKI